MAQEKNTMRLKIEVLVNGARNLLGLSKDVDHLGKESRETATDTDRLNQSLDKQTASSEKATGKIKGLATAMKGLAASLAARFFVQTNADIAGMAKGFELVTGSTEKAREEMEFVRTEAQRLGIDVMDASNAYLSLSAAAKGTALEGEQTRRIFSSVASAMGRLGKSSADTQGALLALQQMISKGKVSAEELRGQLGERLPGAFQAAARAMGVTTGELDEMLQSGELIAEDLLPKFADELDNVFGSDEKIVGFNASWQRFTNTLVFASQEVENATGVMTLLRGALDYAATGVNFISLSVTAMAAGFEAAGKAIGAFFAYLSSDQSWDDFKANVAEAFNEADDKIEKARERISKFDQGLEQSNATLKKSADAHKEAATQTEEHSQAVERNTEKTHELKDATRELEKAEKEQARQAEKAAREAEKLAKQRHDEAVAAAQVTDSLSKNYDALLKLEKAYREGVVTLEEYYTLNRDLIQANIDIRNSQREVEKSSRDAADGMRDLGEAGAQAGEDITAAMKDAAKAADDAADSIRKASGLVAEGEFGRMSQTVEGAIPAGIGERQQEIALQYGQEAADAFMQAVLAAINAGITDVYRLLDAGNRAAIAKVGQSGSTVSGTFGQSAPASRSSSSSQASTSGTTTRRIVLELRDFSGHQTEIGMTDEEQAYALIDALERAGLTALRP